MTNTGSARRKAKRDGVMLAFMLIIFGSLVTIVLLTGCGVARDTLNKTKDVITRIIP